MPRPEWSSTASEFPRRATVFYRELAPCVQRRTTNWEVNGTWEGAGFQVRDLPGASWYHEDEARRCAACGRSDTRCIYLDAEVYQFSTTVIIELECLGCGKYTLWEGDG